LLLAEWACLATLYIWHVEVVILNKCVHLLGSSQCFNLPLLHAAAAAATAVDLQKKDTGEEAASTTQEEFEDNLYLICMEFHKQTKQLPIVCYDNVKFQSITDATSVCHGDKDPRVDSISLIKVDQPTYSPDMNRAIEHVFGEVKPMVRADIYKAARDFSNPAKLLTTVVEAFNKLKPGSVARDVMGLPLLWQVLSTPAGITFQDEKGKLHVGTGGDHPPKAYR